jgi:hypothetical protein
MDNMTNSSSRYREVCCNSGLPFSVRMALSDKHNECCCQFRLWQGFSALVDTFAAIHKTSTPHCILRIVFRRPQIQMPWICAGRVVARMQNPSITRDRSLIDNLPHHPMRSRISTFPLMRNIEHSIAPMIRCCRPPSATVGAVFSVGADCCFAQKECSHRHAQPPLVENDSTGSVWPSVEAGCSERSDLPIATEQSIPQLGARF